MPQRVYDPCGNVELSTKELAPRKPRLTGLRLGILDNSKWNGGKLLHSIATLLQRDVDLGKVNYYKKETFTKPANPELLQKIAIDNDIVLIAIAD